MRIIGGILLILAVVIRDGTSILYTVFNHIRDRSLDTYISTPATYIRLTVAILCLLTAVLIAAGKLTAAGVLQMAALSLQTFFFFCYTVGIRYGTVRINGTTLVGAALLTAMLLYALGLLIRGKAGMVLLIAAGAAMVSYLLSSFINPFIFGGVVRSQIILSAVILVTAGPLYFMGMLFTGIYQGSRK